ncbi:FAD/NAD(P)-binding protein [Telmatospirillum sp.]|uniref:FAD/NAD(P)-binding protein n=1 Tax=Telmatospirillum sp. TaxID=2079197 RepID=UPI002848A949|nr:FAD/NAD(P)-binding protein [Telmatospirillum sp.]MDR3440742.1 FAD/NAD(P)-binding protein [Telmatospirillum sp.]
MNEKIVSVIGGGASAVAFVHHLLAETASRGDGVGLTIYMIERRRHIGRGLAYEQDLRSNILNTKAGFITPFADRPGHFYKWIQSNRELWEDDFPGVKLDEHSYVPRPLFGLYLEHMVADLVREGLSLGCRVIPVQAEAVSVSSNPGGSLTVSTKGSVAFRSDFVVLSMGNLPSREFDHLVGREGFFSSPYPIRKLVRRVPKEATVGILGSRLSAIDAVVGLIESGHVGPITLHSRGGFLPCVRGTQGRYQPKIITADRARAHVARFGSIALQVFVSWVADEMALAGVDVTEFDWDKLSAPTDVAEFLEAEIVASDKPRPWQAVLYATNSIIDYVWRHMSDQDRTFFWRYLSVWMAHRVSIPQENAVKLLAAVRSGQLSVVTGSTTVTHNGANFEVASQSDGSGKTWSYDVLISATGTPRDATLLDSELVEDLLASGMAVPHPFGGIDIDPDTGMLRDGGGRADPRILALGELTSGTFFFTSVLEINARHARDRAKLLVDMANRSMPVHQHEEAEPALLTGTR